MAQIEVSPEIKVYTWDELYSYCIDIYEKMTNNNYVPDVIISIARGGFFTGLVLTHLFRMQNLYSINATTNKNDNIRSERQHPQIESLFNADNIETLAGKRVLIVDDVFNTGCTLKTVFDYLKGLNKDLEIRTACMIYDTYLDGTLQVTDFAVDYYSDRRCAWAVFPWECLDKEDDNDA